MATLPSTIFFNNRYLVDNGAMSGIPIGRVQLFISGAPQAGTLTVNSITTYGGGGTYYAEETPGPYAITTGSNNIYFRNIAGAGFDPSEGVTVIDMTLVYTSLGTVNFKAYIDNPVEVLTKSTGVGAGVVKYATSFKSKLSYQYKFGFDGTNTYYINCFGGALGNNVFIFLNTFENFYIMTNITSLKPNSGSIFSSTSYNNPVNQWDVSNVTDFEAVFKDRTSFNQDVSTWDTSSGVNFKQTFYALLGSSAFNQSLANWDFSKGQDFTEFLYGASSFDQPVGNGSFPEATTFASFFDRATSFNQDISGWTFPKVKSLNRMFSVASSFTTSINTWDVSSVEDFTLMFGSGSTFNQDISGWDVSNGKIFDFMFFNNTTFNQNIGSWNMSSAESLVKMFWGATAFDQNISGWNVSNCRDFTSMFEGATSFNQPIGTWNTSKGRYFVDMFKNSNFNSNIDAWDMSNAVTTHGMFEFNSTFNQPLNSWRLYMCENMSNMFNGCTAFNQPLNNWVVDNVKNMDTMFAGASAFNQNLNDWDTALCTDFDYTFYLSGMDGLNINNWNFQNYASFTNFMTGVPNSFSPTRNYKTEYGGKIGYGSVDFDIIDDGGNKTVEITISFKRCVYAGDITSVVTGSYFTLAPSESLPKAYVANSLTPVTIKLRPVANTTDPTGSTSITITMDNGANPDAVITLDLDHPFAVNTNVNGVTKEIPGGTGFNYRPRIGYDSVGTDFFIYPLGYYFYVLGDSPIHHPTHSLKYYMDKAGDSGYILTTNYTGFTNLHSFSNITASDTINLWDTSNVTDMRGTFFGCTVAFDVSAWDTSSVTNMNQIFSNATNFNSDISGWDVSGLTSTEGMFSNASSFNQSLNSWDVSNVTSMNQMFSGASAFNGNITSWNTGNVTNMSNMFINASAFNQDISGWNVTKVNNFRSMFSGATAFNQDISGWTLNTSEPVNIQDMFYGATSFNQSLNGWDTSAITNMFRMFNGASGFNQSLNSWDTSAVTDMSYMFQNATTFNGDITSWDVSSVIEFRWMFSGASAFNQNIGSWNTTCAIRMDSMFFGASSFNQNIGNWVVNSVSQMGSMFNGASSFNQDISCWGVPRIYSEPSGFDTGTPFGFVNNPAVQPLWGEYNLCSVAPSTSGPLVITSPKVRPFDTGSGPNTTVLNGIDVLQNVDLGGNGITNVTVQSITINVTEDPNTSNILVIPYDPMVVGFPNYRYFSISTTDSPSEIDTQAIFNITLLVETDYTGAGPNVLQVVTFTVDAIAEFTLGSFTPVDLGDIFKGSPYSSPSPIVQDLQNGFDYNGELVTQATFTLFEVIGDVPVAITIPTDIDITFDMAGSGTLVLAQTFLDSLTNDTQYKVSLTQLSESDGDAVLVLTSPDPFCTFTVRPEPSISNPPVITGGLDFEFTTTFLNSNPAISEVTGVSLTADNAYFNGRVTANGFSITNKALTSFQKINLNAGVSAINLVDELTDYTVQSTIASSASTWEYNSTSGLLDIHFADLGNYVLTFDVTYTYGMDSVVLTLYVLFRVITLTTSPTVDIGTGGLLSITNIPINIAMGDSLNQLIAGQQPVQDIIAAIRDTYTMSDSYVNLTPELQVVADQVLTRITGALRPYNIATGARLMSVSPAGITFTII